MPVCGGRNLPSKGVYASVIESWNAYKETSLFETTCVQILANIESAQRNNRLFAALKEGNSALQQLQKQVALADVEKLNEETADAKDYQDQLRELLGQSLSAQDDAEALQELEQIQVNLFSQVPESKCNASVDVNRSDKRSRGKRIHDPSDVICQRGNTYIYEACI